MTRMLNTVSYGEDTGTPLVIVHGLFGSARNWRALAKHFSRRRRVVTVDMRNHGGSFWDDRCTYWDMAGDLAEVVESLGGQADVLGHSMGGKAAMVLALGRPELVSRLIVADIAPVPYAHSQQSNIDIMRRVPIETLTRRSEADALMAQELDDAPVRAFLLSSLDISPDGNRWMLNLDALAENMDDIVGFPSVTGQFNKPVSFVHGGASDYVLPEHKPLIAELFPQASFTTIEGAGHWVHAEKPREFMAAVDAWL